MVTRASSTTAASRYDYGLFVDWCHATQRDPHATTLDTLVDFALFAAAADKTHRRRLIHILRHLNLAGVHLELPTTPTVGAIWKDPNPAEGIDTVPGTLARIPITGWPHGLRGQRDAFLVVACGHLRLTRRRIQHLSPADVLFRPGRVSLNGTLLPVSDHPATCLVCVTGRWLDTLALLIDSPRKTREVFTLARPATVLAQHHHQPVRAVPLWATLLPAIDQHGWTDGRNPLSGRSMSRIITARQDTDYRPVIADEPADSSRTPTMYADLTWDEADAVMDRFCDAADAVLARVEAALGAIPKRPNQPRL